MMYHALGMAMGVCWHLDVPESGRVELIVEIKHLTHLRAAMQAVLVYFQPHSACTKEEWLVT